jgi:hypothetical protein
VGHLRAKAGLAEAEAHKVLHRDQAEAAAGRGMDPAPEGMDPVAAMDPAAATDQGHSL